MKTSGLLVLALCTSLPSVRHMRVKKCPYAVIARDEISNGGEGEIRKDSIKPCNYSLYKFIFFFCVRFSVRLVRSDYFLKRSLLAHSLELI